MSKQVKRIKKDKKNEKGENIMGNRNGRPKKYTEVEIMQEKIDKYFESCYRPVTRIVDGKCINVKKSNGEVLKEQYRPFTVTGLADALDMTRETLLRYGEQEKFSDTIRRAKRKCELYAEERLFDKEGANGAKFSLANNFSCWSDKQKIEHSGNVNNPFEGLSTEELRKILNE